MNGVQFFTSELVFCSLVIYSSLFLPLVKLNPGIINIQVSTYIIYEEFKFKFSFHYSVWFFDFLIIDERSQESSRPVSTYQKKNLTDF